MTIHALALTLDSNYENSVDPLIGSLYHWVTSRSINLVL